MHPLFITISQAKFSIHVGILNSVAEETGIVTTLALKLLFGRGVLLRTLVLCISAGVLATEIDGHENLEEQRHTHQAKKNEVTGVELGRVLLEVDERGKNTTEVTETDVHGNTDTTLGGTTDVVTIPGDTLRNVGVDTAGEEEDTGVLGVRVVRGDLKNDTEHGGESETDHEDTTSAESISEISTRDAAEASNNVRRNTHELSLVVGVAKSFDDGGQEKRKTVERGVNADGNEHVHPDLPVGHSGEEVLSVVLICEGAAVLFQAARDFLLLGIVEELGGLRVVVHVEKGNNGNEEGKKTFKDEDPSPTGKAADTLHLDDTAGEQATEGTSAGCGTEEDGETETTLVTTVPHSDVCVAGQYVFIDKKTS
jgi:hypothetical protein